MRTPSEDLTRGRIARSRATKTCRCGHHGADSGAFSGARALVPTIRVRPR